MFGFDSTQLNTYAATRNVTFQAGFQTENRGTQDRWQRGRMYLTRNQAYVQAYRGFESHPVRHFFNIQAPFKALCCFQPPLYR